MTLPGPGYVYGPVPSRRLGRSLGIDLVPFKTCTYDCLYCQLGRTTNKTIRRREYVPIAEVLVQLRRHLETGPKPDYISLAGSGEPTLNSGIGNLISGIKGMTDIPVAVLTNGSLLGMKDVQDELMAADLILPSLDAGTASMFRQVNRPHLDLSFEEMVDGLAAFTARFPGKSWLEVFLLEGLTGTPEEIAAMAAIIQRINPARVQLNTVSRPPAEELARPVPADRLSALGKLFPGPVDIISETARDDTPAAFPGRTPDADIMALLERRPCTAADVASGLGLHVTEALKHLEALIAGNRVETVMTGGRNFYRATPAASRSASGETERFLQACQADFWQEIFRAERDLLLPYLQAGEEILSVGCGPAVIEGMLGDQGFRVTGLDRCREALDQAPLNIRTVAAPAEHLPLATAAFDAVLFIASLQFMERYEQALEEAARVLRPHGTLLVLLLNTASAFIRDKLRDPDSYVSTIRHTNVHEIEAVVARRYDVQGEYRLGVRDGVIFASDNPTEAVIYLIHGKRKPPKDDGHS